MRNKKILYISQEITPYLKASHLGSTCQMIPHKVQENGFEVRTFMPKYGCINERRNQLHEVIRLSGMNLQVDDTDHPLIIKVATLQASRMQAAAQAGQGERQKPMPIQAEKKIGRNDPCPCGSGKKYKNCHGKGM